MNGKNHIRMFFLTILLCLTVTGCGVSVSRDTSSGAVTSAAAAAATVSPTGAPTGTVSPTAVPTETAVSSAENIQGAESFSTDDIPAYSGAPYVEIHQNVPFFTDADLTETPFENYSDLDSLGRCGVAYANICVDLMPTEERGSISSIHPSGWHSVQYDFVDGNSLYNRCHLIGWQLAGENANEKNLITGTRYLNTQGMLPFENMVADYVKEENAHVLYRVTPIFAGDNLVANGVLMEAESVEDKGEGILFCVYCYNVQPGVEIDYRTGDSRAAEDSDPAASEAEKTTYVLNTKSKKFHFPSCPSVETIAAENRKDVTESRDELISEGYAPCGRCKP